MKLINYFTAIEFNSNKKTKNCVFNEAIVIEIGTKHTLTILIVFIKIYVYWCLTFIPKIDFNPKHCCGPPRLY